MKELKKIKKLLCIMTFTFICCLMVTTTASADMVSNAGLIPAGYGYTHGRIPVIEATGRPEIHDAAIMRYDKNSRIKDNDTAENESNYRQNGNNRQQF